MPTVLRSGPYRLYFYSWDLNEPPHVHVDRDDRRAKFWLDPVALAAQSGVAPHEVRMIEALVHTHRGQLMKAWHDYFFKSP